MGETFADLVYDTLCGDLHGQYAVPGVADAFAEGSPCDQLYDQLGEIRDRLQARMGLPEEDEDVERIIAILEKVQRILSIEMFRYGQKFGPPL